MKKTILAFTLALCGIGAVNAQTEFRHITFDEAKTAAKAENKKIFVDFYTQWCGPCKMLAKQVFPLPEVGDYLNANFVCLKLDAEAEGLELAKKVHVAAYPTLMVFDADGNVIGKFEGSRSPEDFIASVKAIANPDLNPEVINQKYDNGDRTPEVVHYKAKYAMEGIRDYMKGREAANEIITEYYNTLSDAQKLNPENLFVFSEFTWNYPSPRFQYVKDNISKFDADSQKILRNVLKNGFMSEGFGYYSKPVKDDADAKAYESFKKDAVANGYAEDMKNVFVFTDKRAKSSDAEYLAFVDENIANLGDYDVNYLVQSLPNVFPTETKEDKLKISKVLRNNIGKFVAPNVYSAAMVIYQLEEK